MKKKNPVRKVLLIVLGSVMALFLGMATVSYVYRDKLVALFVTELNKHLKTKVTADKIDFSVWDKFPQAAITITNPLVQESVEGSTAPVGRAERLYFTFSLLDLWNQRYQIKELALENGSLTLAVDEHGNPNYLIYQSTDTSASEAISFELEKITLKNVAVHFDNKQTRQHYQLQAHELLARLSLSENGMEVAADGSLHIDKIALGGQTWMRDKTIGLHTKLALDYDKQQLTLKPAELEIQKALYTVAGTVGYGDITNLNLTINGKNTTIQGLLALLPSQVSKKAAAYRSKGQVYFSAKIKGKVTDKVSPLVTVNFGCTNASFYHPDYKEKIENLTFKGTFTNGNRQNNATSELAISGLSGTLQNKPFQADVLYSNFNDPYLNLKLNADLDIASVLAIFPVEGITEGVGQAQLKVAFDGRLADLKKKNNAAYKASGDVRLKDASFLFTNYALLLGNVSGRLQVNKTDFAMQDLRGKLGRSDFEMNGYFRNAVAWLLAGRQDVLLEADLKSRFLDMDELLSQQPASANPAKNTQADSYELTFAPHLACRLQSEIGHMQFRRFRARQLAGELVLQNQVLSTPQMSFKTLGGSMSIKGAVDARNPKLIKTTSISKLNNIHLDSTLYVFENFDQDFLQHKNLRGQLQAGIVADVFFDSKLNPQNQLLEADITATVTNGQLVNFEPVLRMSKLIEERELANLRFSELSNHIQIYNQTIHIPEMEIYTSLSRVPQLSISGTHTLNQEFDYKVRLPLPRLGKQQTTDTPFGKVAQQTSTGTTNLFLTIKGNPDNYKVAYDKERVKEKIKQDIQKEKQELKDALTGKEKPEKEVELNEAEYFEF